MPSDLQPPEDRAVDDPLTCPLCGYDLRGLPANRCPECGHAFDPDELRLAKVERRQWFFEHAPRRVIMSFLRTTAASLWPSTFWRSFAAAHAIDDRRLKTWAACWVAIPTMTAAVAILATAAWIYQQANGSLFYAITPSLPLRPFGTSIGWPRAVDVAARRCAAGPVAVLGGFGLIWPPVVVLAMAVFGHTLSRAGIRRGHLWRCALYAFPSVMLPPTALLLWSRFLGIDPWSVGLCGLIMLALSTLHLAVAHVAYLRLRHAVAQALLVQTLAVLGIFTALVVVATSGL